MTIKKLPKYVWLKSKSGTKETALEHSGGFTYYRVGGAWSLTAVWIGDELQVSELDPIEHIRGLLLVECSRAEWEKDNGRYAD